MELTDTLKLLCLSRQLKKLTEVFQNSTQLVEKRPRWLPRALRAVLSGTTGHREQ
jgi:hypothetical protein